MKNGINNFGEKHPGSIIIFKMVNDPLLVWKKDQSITLFRCYFRINKGHNHFCWCIIAEMMMVTEVFERILNNIFHEGGEEITCTHKN